MANQNMGKLTNAIATNLDAWSNSLSCHTALKIPKVMPMGNPIARDKKDISRVIGAASLSFSITGRWNVTDSPQSPSRRFVT